MFLMLTQNYCQLKAQWNKTDLHYILDFTECKLQALGKHSFKLCLSGSQNPEYIFLWRKESYHFFISLFKASTFY